LANTFTAASDDRDFTGKVQLHSIPLLGSDLTLPLFTLTLA
jgi:hypothetical protein